MKNKILMVSAMSTLAALAPLHAMDNGGFADLYNPGDDLKQLLYWNIGADSAGEKFGENTFAVKTGSQLAQFNTAFAYPTTKEADVEAAVEFMRDVPFSWWVAQDQGDIKALLVEKGFVYSHTEYKMVVHFEPIGGGGSSGDFQGIKIQPVRNVREFELWKKVAVQGLNLEGGTAGEESFSKFFEYVFENGDMRKCTFLIGYLHDEPVSTGMVIYPDDSQKATVHFVSTIEAYRNHGVATALFSELVWQGYDAGGNLSIQLLSSPMAHEWFQKVNPGRGPKFEDVQAYDVYTKGAMVQGVQASARTCHIL